MTSTPHRSPLCRHVAGLRRLRTAPAEGVALGRRPPARFRCGTAALARSGSGAAQCARRAVAADRAAHAGRRLAGHPGVCRPPRRRVGGAALVGGDARGALGDGSLVVRRDRGGPRGPAVRPRRARGARACASVTNPPTGTRRSISAALRLLLPVPARAAEVLDLTGRWCRERSPQRAVCRTAPTCGRRVAAGPATTRPCCSPSAPPGFGFRSGEVWAMHVAWSGDHEHLAERLPEGAGCTPRSSAAASCSQPGEVRLAPGETYTAPEVVFVHSSEGLDGHLGDGCTAASARAPGTAARPRPLVLNTWEAVYFDHRLDRLTELADTAAAIGVERFVLDDGWFGGRRDDTAGLGDWWVSPDGVARRASARSSTHVKGLGHGVRAVVRAGDGQRRLRPRPGPPRLGARPARPVTRATGATSSCSTSPTRRRPTHIEQQISALVSRARHRLHQVGPQPRPARGGAHGRVRVDRPAVHAPDRGLLRACSTGCARAHPDLEIESCSSGGARVDLGVLARTDRIWTSDCNDALERAADPALDLAARAGRADGHPHRPGDGAHHPPHPRPVLPDARRAAGPRRARVGHHHVHARGAGQPWPPGPGSTGSCGPCSTPVTSCAPTCRTSGACS